jgi:hypothetical protein
MSGRRVSETRLARHVQRQTRLPGIRASETRLPDIRASETRLPGIRASETRLPGIRATETRLARHVQRQTRLPDIRASETRMPENQRRVCQTCAPLRRVCQKIRDASGRRVWQTYGYVCVCRRLAASARRISDFSSACYYARVVQASVCSLSIRMLQTHAIYKQARLCLCIRMLSKRPYAL